MYPLSPVVTVMQKAAFAAARQLKRDFGEVEQLQVSRKGPADFVSNADTGAEEILRYELERMRPGCSFLGEESGAHGSDGDGECWIVDPIDGTLNFLHGIPHFAISIAYRVNGRIESGIVYDPIKDEMFRANLGRGAFLNDRRIRVSQRRNLHEAMLATGIRSQADGDYNRRVLARLAAVMPRSGGIRRSGSAALDLVWIAAGRYDGFWESALKIWDVAAGILILREAGGLVGTPDGRGDPFDGRDIVAANGALYRELTDVIASATPDSPES